MLTSERNNCGLDYCREIVDEKEAETIKLLIFSMLSNSRQRLFDGRNFHDAKSISWKCKPQCKNSLSNLSCFYSINISFLGEHNGSMVPSEAAADCVTMHP